MFCHFTSIMCRSSFTFESIIWYNYSILCCRGLISCVKHMSDHCPQTEKQEPILRSFCSLEYIFKFIIQSRLLFARATGGQNEDSFRLDVDSLFESFAHMLNFHLENIETSQVISSCVCVCVCFLGKKYTVSHSITETFNTS